MKKIIGLSAKFSFLIFVLFLASNFLQSNVYAVSDCTVGGQTLLNGVTAQFSGQNCSLCPGYNGDNTELVCFLNCKDGVVSVPIYNGVAKCYAPRCRNNTCTSVEGDISGKGCQTIDQCANTSTPTPSPVATPIPGPYSNFVFVTAAYKAAINSSAQLSSVTYCGYNMSRVGSRAKYGDQTIELWSLTNAPSGICHVVANFDKDPEERIISSTVFYNIDTTNPVVNTISNGNEIATTSSGSLQISSAGPKDSIFVCGYSVDPLANINTTPTDTTIRALWDQTGTAIHSGLTSSITRTLDNETKSLKLSLAINKQFAVNCANLRVKPLPPLPTPVPTVAPTIVPTPTPVSTSIPSPTPTPIPSFSPQPAPVVHTIVLQNKPLDATKINFTFDAITEDTIVTQETSSRFTYNGSFTSANNVNASGGTWKYTTVGGSSVRFTSSAKSLTITSYRCPTCGSYDIYIDGKYLKTVSNYYSSAIYKSPTVINLTISFHSVRLQNMAIPPGSTTNSSFYFDAITENGLTVEQTDARFNYQLSTSWLLASSTLYSGSSTKYNKDAVGFVQFSSTAPTINILTTRCPTCGSFDIYVDNVFIRNINTMNLSATTYKYSVPLSLTGQLTTPSGYKQVRIVKNSNAYTNFNFDAIIENGVKTEDTSPRFWYESPVTTNSNPKTYWKHINNYTQASGGSVMQTYYAGDAVVFNTPVTTTSLKFLTNSSFPSYDNSLTSVNIYIDGSFSKTITFPLGSAYQVPFTIY